VNRDLNSAYQREEGVPAPIQWGDGFSEDEIFRDLDSPVAYIGIDS